MAAARNSDDKGHAFFQKTMQACSRLMQDIVACPKPVTAVDGIATAADAYLVASCDLAVATSSSHFATPGVNIGLFAHAYGGGIAQYHPQTGDGNALDGR